MIDKTKKININDYVVLEHGQTLKTGIVNLHENTCSIPGLILDVVISKPRGSFNDNELRFGNIMNESMIRNMSPIYPIQDGAIVRWDYMVKFWEHVFGKINQLSNRKLVIVNPQTTDLDERYKIAGLMFNHFKVSELAFLPKSHTMIFSSAKSSGVSVIVNESSISIVPIIDGYTITQGIQKLEIGYQDIITTVFKKFIERGYTMTSFTDWEITRDVVKKHCYFSISRERATDLPDLYYDLPSGALMYIGEERTLGPEILFQPDLDGILGPGLGEGIKLAINKVDGNLRSKLYSNIVISGPGSQIPGLGERLFSELHSSNSHRVIDITVHKDPNIVWNSAADIVKTDTVSWISKKQYDEMGKVLFESRY